MSKTTDILVLMALLNNVSVADMLDAIDFQKEQGNWQPASGGSEEPFLTRSGRRLLYCWQPTTGNHAYLDMDNDIILSNEEAQNYL